MVGREMVMADRQIDPIKLLLRAAVEGGELSPAAAHKLEVFVRGECGGQRWYIQRWSWDMRERGLPRPGRFTYRRAG